VLRNGAVYTVDAARSWASALAIRNGRIIYVGTDSLPAALVGPSTQVVDLAGQMVLPGFQDSHVHPINAGVKLGECALDELTTAAEVADTIRAYVAAHPELRWIRGSGWQLPVFPAGNPSQTTLDRLVPDRPAFFMAADGHSVWLNSRALALAGPRAAAGYPPIQGAAARVLPNPQMQLTVRSVTGLANGARPAPARPAGYPRR